MSSSSGTLLLTKQVSSSQVENKKLKLEDSNFESKVYSVKNKKERIDAKVVLVEP